MSLILNGLQMAGTVFRSSLPTKAISGTFIRCLFQQSNSTQEAVPPTKDRSTIIPVETSIKYVASSAFRETYGGKPIWTLYKRNFKGPYLPLKTRKTCIRNNIISTGSPCPICRDEYLVLDYRNVDLIKQFISEYNGDILSCSITGLCQKSYKELLIAIQKAKDYGLLTYDVPVRYYDYEEWKRPDNLRFR